VRVEAELKSDALADQDEEEGAQELGETLAQAGPRMLETRGQATGAGRARGDVRRGSAGK
jgi:hypothetical protein